MSVTSQRITNKCASKKGINKLRVGANMETWLFSVVGDLFTNLGLWVLGLTVSHISESNCNLTSLDHYFS